MRGRPIMINFHEVTYKNFLSCGDRETVIQLDKTPTTIIVGDNGDGKSTFIDALVYVLFGKPFRKVRLGQLINNVNESDLLVTTTFSIGNNKYRIERGMKPSVFNIFANDELIPQTASNTDYQKILENDILKLNYKSFTQIIILGSASYKPFMQLKLSDRREIIENLLDISVFTEMNSILKAQIKDTKSSVQDLTHRMELTKERHKAKREQLNEAITVYDNRVKNIKNSIIDLEERIRLRILDRDGFEDTIAYLLDEISKYDDMEDRIQETKTIIANKESAVNNLKNEIKDVEKQNENISEINEDIARLKKEINEYEDNATELLKKQQNIKLERDSIPSTEKWAGLKEEIAILKSNIFQAEKSLKFYENNDICPECGQDIDDSFADNIVDSLNVDIESFTNSLNSAVEELELVEHNISRIKEIDEYLIKIDKELAFINTKKDMLLISLKEKEDELQKYEYTSPDVISGMKSEVDKYTSEINELRESIKKYVEKNEGMTATKNELVIVEKNYALCLQAIEQYETNVAKLKTSLNELESSSPSSVTEDDINELAEEIKTVNNELEKKKKLLHYYGITQKLLKDDGIKTNIIKKFLPIINATVNMYLDRFNFPINFSFDENFNETIRSNFRKDFCYYSFSEGEKARIDLSILFTWREISIRKSRNAANIIIFDEIFDGSLDAQGAENFMNILGVDDGGFNSFVITHDADVKTIDFDRVLSFSKAGHFSKMKETLT
jgi:DNA repair exonuclease SbcCD ATPase subunit